MDVPAGESAPPAGAAQPVSAALPPATVGSPAPEPAGAPAPAGPAPAGPVGGPEPVGAGAPPVWGASPWASPGWGPPPPPPPPPGSPGAPGLPHHLRRLAALLVAAGVAIALAAGGAGAGIGLALRGGGSTGSPDAEGSASVHGHADAAAIAAAMAPSVVDINDTINGSPAAGTGIIINSGGEVLTNNHVIDGATGITAQVDGRGTAYRVRVLGYDPAQDVALLQIENAPALTAAPIGTASVLRAGDQVVALGNAYGRGGAPAVATGTITALDQTVTASDGLTSETLTGAIQAQLDIVPGDSGGPLVSAAGKVVGMDTAGSTSPGYTTSVGGSATIGYAIPIDTAMSIAHEIEGGRPATGVVLGGSGPLIGVEVQNAAPSAAAPDGGALIVGVVNGSPAAAAGLQAGDVIVSLDGSPITGVNALSTALRGERPGRAVQLGWVGTSGAQHVTGITLGAGPPT